MGVPVMPSLLTVHWMKVLQLSGSGYKQSFGPRHPVAAISSVEHTKSLPLPLAFRSVNNKSLKYARECRFTVGPRLVSGCGGGEVAEGRASAS